MGMRKYFYCGPLLKCSEEYSGSGNLVEKIFERLTEVNNIICLNGVDVWIPNIEGYGFREDDLDHDSLMIFSESLVSEELNKFNDQFKENVETLRKFYTSIDIEFGLVSYWM